MNVMCFVEDEPQGPEAQRWLQEATELGWACSKEIHGDDPQSHSSDIMAIRAAAACLWRTSNGKPCWSRLDAEALRAELASTFPQEMVESSMYTVYAFYCFLAKHGHIPHELAAAAQDRLAPHVERLLRQAFSGVLQDILAEALAERATTQTPFGSAEALLN